eukprot:g187.t1
MEWRSSWQRRDFDERVLTPEQRRSDAAAAVLFGLRELTFIVGDELPAAKADALCTWLHALSVLFPHRAVRGAMRELYAFVRARTAKAPLKRAEWLAQLDSPRFSLGGYGRSPTFGYCGGGKGATRVLAATANSGAAKLVGDSESRALNPPNPNMFTCSQWTLFHLLASSAANAPALQKSPGRLALRTEAKGMLLMRAIRAWVSEFFACSECRNHFLRMYDSCAMGRCRAHSSTDTALWLWRAHNAVNIRLAAERRNTPHTEAQVQRAAQTGPDSVTDWDSDVQWPFAPACPRCAAGSANGSEKHPKERKWQPERVIAHLHATYWSHEWGSAQSWPGSNDASVDGSASRAGAPSPAVFAASSATANAQESVAVALQGATVLVLLLALRAVMAHIRAGRKVS